MACDGEFCDGCPGCDECDECGAVRSYCPCALTPREHALQLLAAQGDTDSLLAA